MSLIDTLCTILPFALQALNRVDRVPSSCNVNTYRGISFCEREITQLEVAGKAHARNPVTRDIVLRTLCTFQITPFYGVFGFLT